MSVTASLVTGHAPIGATGRTQEAPAGGLFAVAEFREDDMSGSRVSLNSQAPRELVRALADAAHQIAETLDLDVYPWADLADRHLREALDHVAGDE